MKPAWDQLAAAFEGSSTAIIGDVDCTSDKSKDLCSKYGVRGYPTIKYFTESTDPLGDSYDGGRDFDALKAFADDVRPRLLSPIALSHLWAASPGCFNVSSPILHPRIHIAFFTCALRNCRIVGLRIRTPHTFMLRRTWARHAAPTTLTSAPTSRRQPSPASRPSPLRS